MKSSLNIKIRSIVILLLGCLILLSCKDKTKFEVNGKILNVKPATKVFLFGFDPESETPLDSAVVSNKGEFKIDYQNPEVDFFRIQIEGNEYIIIARNGDVVHMEADLADKTLDYKLSGADEADKLEELNKNKNAYIAKIAAIQTQFEETVESQPQNRAAIANQMRPALIQENDAMIAYILKFAMDNTNYLSGFYAINSLNPGDYEQEMIAYADKIKSNFKQNKSVGDFVIRMSKLRSVQIGQLAPDFTMNSIDGKPVKLSSLRGKYVLLDFWASWCQPCRQENPNVVNMYKKYKDRGFTVLGVSLDKDPAAWKKAILDDGLTWTHLSELKDFESPTVRLYQVQAIPSSFLLDPEGKIIAKNLRGDELNSFLDQTLK